MYVMSEICYDERKLIEGERVGAPQFADIYILEFGKDGSDPIHLHSAYISHVCSCSINELVVDHVIGVPAIFICCEHR